jgi:hypothetical protein
MARNEQVRLDDLPDTFPLWPVCGRLLGLGRNATFAAAARGEVPVLRFGRKLVVSKRALVKLLDEGRLGPTDSGEARLTDAPLAPRNRVAR